MNRRQWEIFAGRLSFASLGIAVALAAVLAGCTMLSQPPVAAFSITPSTTGQAPFDVEFSGFASSDPDDDIETYQWDFGDGTQGTGMVVGHVYNTPGTYSVVLKVTDSTGKTDQTFQTVVVQALPNAAFTATPSAGTSPLSVWFDASASTYSLTPLSYEWNFGDGQLGTGQIATHQYSAFQGATYTVTLTVRGTDGTLDTATQQITVLSPGGGGGPCAL